MSRTQESFHFYAVCYVLGCLTAHRNSSVWVLFLLIFFKICTVNEAKTAGVALSVRTMWSRQREDAGSNPAGGQYFFNMILFWFKWWIFVVWFDTPLWNIHFLCSSSNDFFLSGKIAVKNVKRLKLATWVNAYFGKVTRTYLSFPAAVSFSYPAFDPACSNGIRFLFVPKISSFVNSAQN